MVVSRSLVANVARTGNPKKGKAFLFCGLGISRLRLTLHSKSLRPSLAHHRVRRQADSCPWLTNRARDERLETGEP